MMDVKSKFDLEEKEPDYFLGSAAGTKIYMPREDEADILDS